MSLDHKNVTRINDEYVCTHCGKSWDVSDTEPPACEFSSAAARPVYVRSRHHGTISSGPVPGIQNLPRKEMKPCDLAAIEQRILGVMRDCDYGAYLISYHGKATLIYANNMIECVTFYGKVAGQLQGSSRPTDVNDVILSVKATDLRFERAKSLDCYCTGRTPRVEMNPSILAKASEEHTNNGNQYPVISIIEFAKHFAGELK